MAKSTIGQFMSALRKANGMTQQDVANRLNVSNKAVSRWERDECAPDISLLPAIAEMYGITCDELLKGERILESPTVDKNTKIEKQVKSLISRTLTGFKTLIWISLAVSIIGLVCMFGISYGFYRPVIGFSIMILFEICALLITILAVNKTKAIKENELFEMANNKLITHFNNTLANMSFHSFFTIFSSILLSIPLILFETEYMNSVLSIYSYFTVFFSGIVLILLLVYTKFKEIFIFWIIENKLPPKSSSIITQNKHKLNLIQFCLIILASIIFVYSPYLDFEPNDGFALYECCIVVGLLCLLASIIYFLIFIKRKDDKNNYFIIGIRNIFYIPSTVIASNIHHIEWHQYVTPHGTSDLERYDVWKTQYLW